MQEISNKSTVRPFYDPQFMFSPSPLVAPEYLAGLVRAAIVRRPHHPIDPLLGGNGIELLRQKLLPIKCAQQDCDGCLRSH